MAARKRITAQSLLRETCGETTRYSGTRAELIEARLAREGDFPGDPGAPITSCTMRRDGQRSYIRIRSRLANPMTFWVENTPLEAIRLEKEQFRKEICEETAARAVERRHEAAAAQAHAHAAIAKLPKNASEYLERVVAAFYVAVNIVRPTLIGNGSPLGGIRDDCITDGYRLDADSLAAFEEAIEEAIEVLRSARVLANREGRNAAVTAIRAKAAKADSQFSRFMRRVAPPSKRHEPPATTHASTPRKDPKQAD